MSERTLKPGDTLLLYDKRTGRFVASVSKDARGLVIDGPRK